MRNRFDLELEQLNMDLIDMGELCENAIADAVEALDKKDKELAKKAIDTEKEIDGKEKEIENLCLKLLLSQQPVARDLRLISSALKMITDMERIGDQAEDIAEIIIEADFFESFNHSHISIMASKTRKMVTDSISAFVKRDYELATRVIKDDDEVDKLFGEIKNDIILLISSDKSKGAQAMDILMVAKYLERIGDHATNIAEWVLFSITGRHE